MKILITGCKGQLGNEIIKQLKHGKSELGAIPDIYKNAEIRGVDLEDFDLSDKAAVTENVEKGGYDLVINCAAYTNVNGCETNQDTAYKANAIAPMYLAAACEKSGAKLVHISTDYVFAGNADAPYREYDVTAPQSVYGKTKLAGETYVRENCSRYFILRTSWLYGYIGNNFVKTMIKAATEKGACRVVNDQFGNPTSAVDVAHHILLIAATENYGLYHCTCNGICSWYDFTCEIVRLAGIAATVSPCTTDEYPTPAKRPAYSALDNMGLRTTVGDGMRDWHDALAEYIKNLAKEANV